MKIKKNSLIIIISIIVLISLLLIQINWIFQTAKAKEELFNEKATMVLSRTVQELNSDIELCAKMNSCCLTRDQENCPMYLEESDVKKIDSLLKYFMNYYHFHIDYSFEVLQDGASITRGEKSELNTNSYKKRLEEVASVNGIELKLNLPGQSTFIKKEMGIIFITSILLIFIVSYLFIRTVLSLRKEEKVSKKTTEFLNNITHEFKTPLTNIGIAGRLLLKEGNIDQKEKIEQYSGIILSENEKLKSQVEQILTMAALERGEIPRLKDVVDFHALLQERLKCISVQFENSNHELSLQLLAKNHTVIGDKIQFSNLINNLVENAIKYSPENSNIEIETRNTNNGKLEFLVRDYGIGISAEELSSIFNKYYRVSTGDVHNVKGFGLGLAYVKKVVELNDGTIEVNSKVGKGTTFKIILPVSNG